MNDRPKVFIGSSVESLKIAYAIQTQLQFNTEPTVWSQGIFNLTSTAFEDLLDVLANSDFAIFIFTPDDTVKIRGNEHQTVRDNLVYEFGLAVGILGRNRVFIVAPSNQGENFHLPSDLKGIGTAEYDNNRGDKNIDAALGPAIYQIQKQIDKEKERIKNKKPSRVIKDFFHADNLVNEIIVEHPYDFPPKVTLMGENGQEILSSVIHEPGKVRIGGHIKFNGRVILYGESN